MSSPKFLYVSDDHPIDEQFHQPASLFESGIVETTPYPLAEIFHATDHAGELRSLLRLRPQLPLLSRERLVPLLPTSPGVTLIWPLLSFSAVSTVQVATGIAILKYRLYDIDRIINRPSSTALSR